MTELHEIVLENAPLEDLERELLARDQRVQELRSEMAVLKPHINRHHIRLQTEAAGRAPAVLTQGVRFELGGK